MSEQSIIAQQATTDRWKRIRENPKCDLSLTAGAVAGYLGTPESVLVQERIRESLVQLARYRLGEVAYLSWDPTAPGDLATCEGLETFLVPAVEEAVPFTTILTTLGPSEKVAFSATFVSDVNGLLKRWEKNVFSGKPYADEKEIGDSLQPPKDKTVNIVEAAAMACRVLIHLLTLKLTRANEGTFEQTIGKDIDEKRLFLALENALEFLIRSFQKADGKSEEDRIGHACVAGQPGSGWSWTEWPGLPPMLFFTAAAVDAFAELDLYLIRAVGGRNQPAGVGWQKLADFYTKNKERFEVLQFCVDMARRWVQSRVLPYMSDGAGVYVEPGIVFKPEKEAPADIKAEMESEGLKLPPTRLYNNLYAMQVLLWSWADWDDRGQAQDQSVKSDINRALTQLLYNYDSVPGVRRALKKSAYFVVLPRNDKFQKPTGPQPDYMDKGFLPLLTRLLVLFAVYGVGDRNLIEPVIRNLYVELLQSRNRTDRKYSALWSSHGVEVFATQRAIQALTFYFAYTRGKEKAQVLGDRGNASHDVSDDLRDVVIFRNRTGRPLVIEAVAEGTPPEPAKERGSEGDISSFAGPMPAETFAAYVRLLRIPLKDTFSEEAANLRQEIAVKGKALVAQLRAGELKDPELGKAIVHALACLFIVPVTDGNPRTAEFNLLIDLARQLGAS